MNDVVLRRATGATAGVVRQLLAESALKQLADVLDKENLRFLVLKGPHLAATVYSDPTHRHFDDLDILVRAPDFNKAWQALQRAGFRGETLPKGYDPKLLAPNGWLVELHRALVPYALYPVSIEELFDRSTGFQFGRVATWGLGREDLLLHLVMHAAKSHFRALAPKHIEDIALLSSSNQIDWEVFVARARQWRCSVASWLMLQAAVNQRDADVPVDVLSALEPSGRRRWWLAHWFGVRSFPVLRHARLPRAVTRTALAPAMRDDLWGVGKAGLRFIAGRWTSGGDALS